ncbi:hypothetical protein CC80DRAFT_510702 [Byssothecium circinans]|uniref:Uncharacterized protein n=1 Tax=Byssothecium circinans TaxID=147558 RepID=A0A6A5TBR6_9PLEO|nr:hypothetical protein CC80DRAFT_510702 [Byssothecium circinans]
MSSSSRSSEETSHAELAYFFKHTQPAPTPVRTRAVLKKKRNITAAFLTALGKKDSIPPNNDIDLGKDRGRRATVPPCPELPPMLKSVVREEVTSSGARHLYIDISGYEDGCSCEDGGEKEGVEVFELMASEPKPPSTSSKATPSNPPAPTPTPTTLLNTLLTDDIFTPLGSSPVEHGFLGTVVELTSPPTSLHTSTTTNTDAEALPTPCPAPRSPRPVPVMPTRVLVPVGKSPLTASRGEEVRGRKLRDRGKGVGRAKGQERVKGMERVEGQERMESEKERFRRMAMMALGGEGERNQEGLVVGTLFDILNGEGGVGENDGMHGTGDEDGEGTEGDVLLVAKGEWERLNKLNAELAMELVREIGLESRGVLGADEVLHLCRVVRRDGVLRG